MDPVVHFEMPVGDKKRTAEFYSKVFGWKMTQLGEEMGGYLLAGTVEVDENNMAKKPGAINGGFYSKADTNADPHPHVVISVADLQDSMKKVASGGGKVEGEPVDIPGIGAYVSFIDTEGNRVGMLQPVSA